ncbi:MAG: D-alanyl-D-alanine carboxypeptidase/D-alanyl-D-alanine-endopeptidase, partial [Bacteroidales bacterium]|nr:D-alanyl-D-alanine carboxypeptidase/D-alanyl-D-alanine-endopeptidase [Bacteroidales bacterium]
MRAFFSVVLCFVALFGFSQSPKFQSTQDKFIANPEFANAIIGMYAENLKTGEVLLDHNSRYSLTPASVMKLFTTCIAVDALGQNARFRTSLAYSGSVENGVLNGDIYIIGGGDPCFAAERYSNLYGEDIFATWVEKITEAGISKINGNIIGDISYFGVIPYPDKWLWEDLGAYYGTQGASINYQDNVYSIFFKTGADGDTAQIVKIVPEDMNLNIVSDVKASSKVTDDNTIIYRGNAENDIVIKGVLPCNKEEFKIKGCIPNPPQYVTDKLYRKLVEFGISVSGGAVVTDKKYEAENERTELHTVMSPSVITIVNYANSVSCNLYAEILRLQVMHKTGRDFAAYAAGYFDKRAIDSKGFFAVDGSGVS